MMKTRLSKLLLGALLLSTPALAQDEENVIIHRGPGMGMHGGAPMMVHLGTSMPAPVNGIPPHIAEKIGVPRDVAQRVQELAFQSNEAVIPIESDLRRTQLRLERLLSAESPDERAILTQVEEVGRAETAVRRNRITLMVQIKKLLGPDLWRKLEAELGPMRIEKRIELRKKMLGEPGEPREPRPGSGTPPRKP